MDTIKIKNMVCDRCVMTVRQVLEDLGHKVESVRLGQAEISEQLDEEQLILADKKLCEKGFELIKENSKALVEQIKTELINYLEHIEKEEEPKNFQFIFPNNFITIIVS